MTTEPNTRLTRMCHVLKLNRSSFYKWVNTREKRRLKMCSDALIGARIKTIFDDEYGLQSRGHQNPPPDRYWMLTNALLDTHHAVTRYDRATVCTPDRNINPEQVSRLAHGQWCHLGQNIVILGKSSVGKTYLAQALITAACRNDYSARFYRTDMLAAELAVLQPEDPIRLKFIQHLHDVDVLVLDDFLTTPIDAATAHQLLNILAGREGKVSTIVTSQFTPLEWYKSIPDAVISESILNRLVSGAEIITLEGPNMRLTTNA